MKLNIETKNPESVLGIIKENYLNCDVTLDKVYESTADYTVINPLFANDPHVFSVEGLYELAHDLGYGYTLWKIRVY